jgi:hypothetical protein
VEWRNIRIEKGIFAKREDAPCGARTKSWRNRSTFGESRALRGVVRGSSDGGRPGA